MGEAGLALALLSLAFVGAAVRVGRREQRAFVQVAAAELAEPLLVVIPARDEEARLPLHLAWLLKEPSPHLRVLVVDDRSQDATAARVEELCARDARLALLRLDDDPPPGVFGKPRALAAAVAHARGRGWLTPLVLFLDADVRLEAGALGGLVRALRAENAQALSGVPRLLAVKRVEQLLVPTFAAVLLGRFLPSRVHDARSDTAFLNGQLILVDSAALDAAGGWEAVQHTVLEDVALARRLKGNGARLRLADLRALAATRMYDSWAGIRDGFGKNAVALLGKSAGVVGLGAFVTSLFPWSALLLAGASRRIEWVAPVVVVVAAVMLLQARARRQNGVPRWPVLALPLAYLGVALVLVGASARALIGAPVVWKGRSYRG
jgi:cellulose synthase/poly-beta-1,6-N-acetylglucosamine synthase-like glycosyltransferase